MKLLAVLAVVVVAASAVRISDEEVNTKWEAFKSTHGKTYESDVHEQYRKMIFKEKLHKIAKHNARYENGEVSFKLGVNKRSDMLTHEVTSKLNGYKVRSGRTKNYGNLEWSWPWSLPSSVNWTAKGYVTAIKDQGDCGGCWAFSTTGSLEGAHYKETKTLTSFSEQQLIDCSSSYGNEGCDGGLMDDAFQYVQAYGIETEASYPFTSASYYDDITGSCSYDSSEVVGESTGYTDVSESESALKRAVAKKGPVSVAIDASLESFDMYESGIYYESSCSSTDLDHGVLAVGYGSDDGEDYWLVKNSWGTDWGLEGYIKMARNRDNNCGIASEASYPTW